MSGLSLNQLPDLCLRRIFSFLNLHDLNRCRAVCRLFKLFADQTGVQELYVYYYAGYQRECWHLTDRPMERGDTIPWNKFSTLNSRKYKLGEFQMRLLQQVKFLCVCPPNRRMYTDVLNEFKQLIQLEIKNTHGAIHVFHGQKELSLPNLRVLNLTHIILRPPVLNTPKLEVLCNKEIEKLEIKYPESIKWLESNYPSTSVMDAFKNVEVFRCHLSAATDLNRDLLSSWKNLKELRLLLLRNFYVYRPQWEVLRSSLGHILSQRVILEREELRVYWKDILLMNASQLQDYDAMEHIICDIRFKYRSLASPPLVTYRGEVNYNDLIGQIGQPDIYFFMQFPSIETVDVTGVFDPDQLESFLERTPNLRKLKLTNTSMGQQFYDNLPNIAGLNRRLTHLQITEIQGLFTNFQFISNFDNLIEFNINIKPQIRGVN